MNRILSRPRGRSRPLQLRVRGLPDRFAEWEVLGALAGLAREWNLEVEVEWLVDGPTGGERAAGQFAAH